MLRCFLGSPSTRRASATTTRSPVNYFSRGMCRLPSNTSSATRAESTLQRFNTTSTVCRSTISTARRQATIVYVQLFNSEMRRILDLHVQLKTRTRRAGRNVPRWLSIEARDAKRSCRRLDCRYSRTLAENDKANFQAARAAARKAFAHQYRSDAITKRFADVAGDHAAT